MPLITLLAADALESVVARLLRRDCRAERHGSGAYRSGDAANQAVLSCPSISGALRCRSLRHSSFLGLAHTRLAGAPTTQWGDERNGVSGNPAIVMDFDLARPHPGRRAAMGRPLTGAILEFVPRCQAGAAVPPMG